MKIGACYYPEHWAAERLVIDVRMMREAGFNVIHTGYFKWTLTGVSTGYFLFQLARSSLRGWPSR